MLAQSRDTAGLCPSGDEDDLMREFPHPAGLQEEQNDADDTSNSSEVPYKSRKGNNRDRIWPIPETSVGWIAAIRARCEGAREVSDPVLWDLAAADNVYLEGHEFEFYLYGVADHKGSWAEKLATVQLLSAFRGLKLFKEVTVNHLKNCVL